LNRLVLAAIAKGEQRHLDMPSEDRITDDDLDGIEAKIMELVRGAASASAPAAQPEHVCGLQGYQRGSTPDPICPACAASTPAAPRETQKTE
jgi:hypothetical protein